MAPYDSDANPHGRHSQQAVEARQAQERERLAQEQQYARETLLAAQDRADIKIPHHRKSYVGLVLLLILIALALALFFGRNAIAQFAQEHGISLPFLTTQTQELQTSHSSSSLGAESKGNSSSSAAFSSSSSPAHSSSGSSTRFTLTPANLADIPRTKAFGGFSLDPQAQAPIPSSSAREAIENAYADIEATGECAFVFLDVQSGRGMAYNAGQQMSSAGVFKAPYAYYLLSNAEQGALFSDDDRNNVKLAITQSDNDAYDALHYARDTQDYYNWLESHGITDDSPSGFYPSLDAATMTQLWFELNQYLVSDSKEAAWLKDELSHSDVSFIRKALDGTESKVWNQGGWTTDKDDTALNDAGIIESSDGKRYLMVILTSQKNSDEAQAKMSTLARALFDARSALA